MSELPLILIQNILERVDRNTSGIFSKVPEPIFALPPDVSDLVEDTVVHISEFIIAKVQGKIGFNKGHPEITPEILLSIPNTLCKPSKIYEDKRTLNRTKYLFICNIPLHQIVVEIRRMETGKTEINTIFDMRNSELKRLEGKLPTIFSSTGGAPTSSSSRSQRGRFSGVSTDKESVSE